jgi:xylulokinase
MRSNREAVLALDLGTGGCKGALYSKAGASLHFAAADYPLHTRPGGVVEQNPADYLRAARKVSATLAAQARERGIRIRAVTFSTQTPTLIFCDERGRAVAPAIVWQDTRAGAETALLKRHAAAERRQWFGMDLPLGAASTPSKLLWMKRHAPAAWSATRSILQPKDYVAAALTGNFAADAWCAKGIVSIHGEAHPTYLKLLGKRVSPCPPLLAPSEPAGSIKASAARRWGLDRGTPVMTGWSDALAGVLSTGAFHSPGRGFIITGTSEIIGVSRRGGACDPGLFLVPAALFPCHGLDLHYGPIQGGGGTLSWAARLFHMTPDQALALLPDRLKPVDIVFRPYLAGERAPFWNHALTAGFQGLRASHGPADLLTAVLQGVALQERLVLERAGAGKRAQIALAGGGARDKRWNRLRADILQRSIVVLRDLEASLHGAALLGWSGLGEVDLRQPGRQWFAGFEIAPDRSYEKFSRDLMKRFTP